MKEKLIDFVTATPTSFFAASVTTIPPEIGDALLRGLSESVIVVVSGLISVLFGNWIRRRNSRRDEKKF